MVHFAEAALGCFKDEMLHLLTKKHINFSSTPSTSLGGYLTPPPLNAYSSEDTIQRIRLGLSRAILQETGTDKGWDPIETERGDGEKPHNNDLMCEMYAAANIDYRYGNPSMYGNDGEGSTWSACIGCDGAAEQHGEVSVKQKLHAEDTGEESDGGKNGSKDDAKMFGSDCVLWDLTDDLMSQIV
ncbi:hypothetical protein KSP40_PGU001320 [Platanthera guangdongensis]|uniref:Uncharacterized protein n=1 Tax=Platanthera guangdongensis TaxID=2320717 RepID=A0ABR2LC84_9ASPA